MSSINYINKHKNSGNGCGSQKMQRYTQACTNNARVIRYGHVSGGNICENVYKFIRVFFVLLVIICTAKSTNILISKLSRFNGVQTVAC